MSVFFLCPYNHMTLSPQQLLVHALTYKVKARRGFCSRGGQRLGPLFWTRYAEECSLGKVLPFSFQIFDLMLISALPALLQTGGSPSREEAQNLLDVSLGLIDDPLDEAETLLHGLQLQPSDATEMAADLDSTFTALSLTHGTPREDARLGRNVGEELLETTASAHDAGFSGDERALVSSPTALEPKRQQPLGMASPSRSFAKV